MTDDPTPSEILRALRELLISNPHLRGYPVDDVAHDLLLSGYLQKEPDPILVGEALRELARERLGNEEDAKAEAETHELQVAGWERLERQEDGPVWRNPRSGLLYPQGVAIAMVREGAKTDLPLKPEGDA